MPRREALALVAWLLGTDFGGVIARRPDPIPADVLERLEDLLARREAREPFQYLTGEQEFHGLSFHVDRRVLIPRPETEVLVQAVLGLGLPPGARVADLGTGSGCIAVSVAVERPDLAVLALDASGAALEVARLNAERHRVAGRVSFVRGTFASPPPAWNGTIDVVACNPPYVSESEWSGLAPEVRAHEPREALVPGPRGLEAYAEVAASAGRLLLPGGRLVVELGYGREAEVTAIVSERSLAVVRVLPDLRGIPRVLLASRSETASRAGA